MRGIPDTLWRRHYNPWSWYTRIAFAYVLYYGIWLHDWRVIGLMALTLTTNWFWFPAPRDEDTFFAHAVKGESLWVQLPWTRRIGDTAILAVTFTAAIIALWRHQALAAVALISFVTIYKLFLVIRIADFYRRHPTRQVG